MIGGHENVPSNSCPDRTAGFRAELEPSWTRCPFPDGALLSLGNPWLQAKADRRTYCLCDRRSCGPQPEGGRSPKDPRRPPRRRRDVLPQVRRQAMRRLGLVRICLKRWKTTTVIDHADAHHQASEVKRQWGTRGTGETARIPCSAPVHRGRRRKQSWSRSSLPLDKRTYISVIGRPRRKRRRRDTVWHSCRGDIRFPRSGYVLLAIPEVLQQDRLRFPGMLFDTPPQTGPELFQLRPGTVEEAVYDFKYL
ncbi:hypothetical protein ACVWZ8_004043 [Arthrobacter sp. UYCu723]